MIRPDDSTLDQQDLLVVEARARALLDRAAAWDRLPTPVDDIIAAANLKVAPKSAFDPASFLAFIKKKSQEAAQTLKAAIAKVLGLYDANDEVIHIDDTSCGPSRQTFLKLHETGHHELPTHRKVFRLFQDCEQTLAPEIADRFEREANNFARFALFQDTAFKIRAADMAMGVTTPIKLAKLFGASIYASAREYARTHHRACVVYVLEPVIVVPGAGFQAPVRRIETSPSFHQEFGMPGDTVIDHEHALANLVPIGRKMTRPTNLVFRDRNGVDHECLGEAFDSTRNIFLLIYPVKALTSTTVIIAPTSTMFGRK